MTEPVVADSPAALLCQELTAWQATSPTTPSFDFDDVLTAAQPLLKDRFAWSVNFTGDGSSDYPVAQHINLLHVSGSSLTTVVVDYPIGLGSALAGLIGLRLSPDAAASSVRLDAVIEQADAAAKPAKAKARAAEPAPETIAAPEPVVEPLASESSADDPELSEADQKTCLAMLKALPADARRGFTIAFRAHFEVPDSVKQVGACITHMRHQLFVQDFIDEIELQGGHE
jgi:hypothetical protein